MVVRAPGGTDFRLRTVELPMYCKLSKWCLNWYLSRY